MSSNEQNGKKNNYDDIKVDEHGWPEEAYEKIEYPVHKDDPKNKQRLVLIIAASVIASLLATLIVTTIYRNWQEIHNSSLF